MQPPAEVGQAGLWHDLEIGTRLEVIYHAGTSKAEMLQEAMHDRTTLCIPLF